ncbi:MAG: helix-turn-helix domain-containing protein [Cetobacterium sp.]|nr:helix-turn-helix domain-containing protein [Cetobacterium sp.]
MRKIQSHTKTEILFSKKINQLRIKRNLSLEKAGNLIGIPMVELYKYEKLELSPTLLVMEKIAKAYNVSLDSLYKKESEEIVAYKLLIRSFLEIKNYPIMILFETIIDKQEYLKDMWLNIEAYFTKKEGEIIIELIKDTNALPYQIIRWQDYTKYKATILNPQKKIKEKKENYESIFRKYEPYSEKFEDILKKYKLEVKERKKIFLRCVGIEEALMLTRKDLKQFQKKNF